MKAYHWARDRNAHFGSLRLKWQFLIKILSVVPGYIAELVLYRIPWNKKKLIKFQSLMQINSRNPNRTFFNSRDKNSWILYETVYCFLSPLPRLTSCHACIYTAVVSHAHPSLSLQHHRGRTGNSRAKNTKVSNNILGSKYRKHSDSDMHIYCSCLCL